MLRDALEVENFPTQIRKPNKNPPVALSAEFINACYAVNFLGIHISINSTCTKSINDYLLVQEKTDGTMKKPKNSEGVELLGHISDSARYLLAEAFSSQFNQYINRRHNKEPERMISPVDRAAY